LALDYRGHGQSEYDRNPENYTLPVALADLSAVLTPLEIVPAIFVGTSCGGLLAMMLAVWRPTAIAGVILNDIGPVIEPQGLVRIKGYVGKLPTPRTFEEGPEIAAACTSLVCDSEAGFVGLARNPTTIALGTSSCSNSSRFAASVVTTQSSRPSHCRRVG
jgi:pimeloyl-ACP methyl ester carboxylesterase